MTIDPDCYIHYITYIQQQRKYVLITSITFATFNRSRILQEDRIFFFLLNSLYSLHSLYSTGMTNNPDCFIHFIQKEKILFSLHLLHSLDSECSLHSNQDPPHYKPYLNILSTDHQLRHKWIAWSFRNNCLVKNQIVQAYLKYGFP